MAQVRNGSFNTSGYSDPGYPDHFVFSWTLISQSIEGNYSDISWSLKGEGGSSNGYFTNVKEKYVTVNGVSQSNSTIQAIYNNTVAFSGTSIIYHNSDGTKSFSASAGGAFYNYGSYNSTGSGTWELPTIPRASTISGGSGIIGQATTISITRASSSFTHTLEYAFGNLTGTIATGVNTSYSWTIPTSFYSQIPNTNTGTGTITCKTYNGTTLIGTKSIPFTAEVTNSNPVVGTFTYKDNKSSTVAITGNNQRIIRNNSNLLFTIGPATANNSATISNYEVTFNGVTKSTAAAGTLDFGTINLSSNAIATLKVTDSRGNTATKQITVIIDDWILPTALITLNRKNNFYSETYLTVDASYSSLNSRNTITIQYKYKKVTDTVYSALQTINNNVKTTINLDNNFKWDIQIILTDKIGQTSYNYMIDRGMPIMFFDRFLSAIGINCFPTEEKSLKVDGNSYANNTADCKGITPSSFNNVGTNQELYKSGLFSAFVSNIWYHLINVRHRNGQSDGTSYGLQIRNRFSDGYKLEYRKQNNGTWSDWKTIAEEGIVLFNNTSGTTSNITLSETSANFNAIEIVYCDNNNRGTNTLKVDSPNGKEVHLSIVDPSGSDNFRIYIRSSAWTISGTSLAHKNSKYAQFENGQLPVINKNQYIKILKVVGYR